MTRVEKIRLRLATERDIPFMQDLYASVREPEFAATGLPPESVKQFLALQFAAQHQHYMSHYNSDAFHIVEIEDAPVGRLFIDYWEREIRIVDIALLPEIRGQGIGRYLLSSILVEATAKALPVSIHVERNNPALRLYERLGFKVTARRDDIYLLMEWHPQ